MTDEAVAGTADDQDTAPGAEATGTQEVESLDSILAEYDRDFEEPHKPTQKDSGQDEPEDDDVRQFIKDLRERELSKAFEDTMTSAVKTMREAVKGDMEVELSDRAWRGIVHDAANSDPRVRQAFVNRHKNPSGFNKVLRALAKEEAKSFVSKSETDTRDQVNAAVRASQKRPPVNPAEADGEYRQKFMKMSQAERAAEKRRLLNGG